MRIIVFVTHVYVNHLLISFILSRILLKKTLQIVKYYVNVKSNTNMLH